MSLRHFAVIPFVVLAVACAGPEGPIGPAGPTGPQGPTGATGPQGPAGVQQLVVTATIDGAGDAVVTLPTAVGTNGSTPPAVSCYTAPTITTGAWLAVSDGFTVDAPYCGLAFNGSAWTVQLHQGIPGWVAAWVVVY